MCVDLEGSDIGNVWVGKVFGGKRSYSALRNIFMNIISKNLKTFRTKKLQTYQDFKALGTV